MRGALSGHHGRNDRGARCCVASNTIRGLKTAAGILQTIDITAVLQMLSLLLLLPLLLLLQQPQHHMQLHLLLLLPLLPVPVSIINLAPARAAFWLPMK